MNSYEVWAFILMFVAIITGSAAWVRALDEYVKEYAHDIRKGL
jgi:hypothetical protein